MVMVNEGEQYTDGRSMDFGAERVQSVLSFDVLLQIRLLMLYVD